MWVSLGDCRQPLEGEDYITDDDDGNESEDYNNDYADDDVDDIVNEEGDYDVAYPKMDVAWEELLEYLEEQEMDLSDLSDEEFIELMDKMYNDL